MQFDPRPISQRPSYPLVGEPSDDEDDVSLPDDLALLGQQLHEESAQLAETYPANVVDRLPAANPRAWRRAGLLTAATASALLLMTGAAWWYWPAISVSRVEDPVLVSHSHRAVRSPLESRRDDAPPAALPAAGWAARFTDASDPRPSHPPLQNVSIPELEAVLDLLENESGEDPVLSI